MHAHPPGFCVRKERAGPGTRLGDSHGRGCTDTGPSLVRKEPLPSSRAHVPPSRVGRECGTMWLRVGFVAVAALVGGVVLGPGIEDERRARDSVRAASPSEDSLLVPRSPSASTRPARPSDGLQAPNRAHDLRTYFEPDGSSPPRPARALGEPLVALRLATLGRGGDCAVVGRGRGPPRARTASRSRATRSACASGT